MFKKLRGIPLEVRAWIYRVLTAAMPLAVTGGLVTDDKAQVYLLVAAAVLGVASGTLAVANTPRS